MLDEARAHAAPEIPRRRCRHHRRQFPRRRDRLLDHRHQRGQWRPDADPAQGAYRARQLEKIVPTLEDASTLLRLLARSATGQEFSTYTTVSTGPRRADDTDGPGEYHVVLLDNGRSALLRRRVSGHAALHPLRRLPQPLPGLRRGRRPCLWLGLSRADGRGADADADRHRGGRQSAQRLDLLRPLRKRLPDEDSAAEDDAALARARIRAAFAPSDDALGPRRSGRSLRATPGALSPRQRDRRRACSAGSGAGAGGSARCRWPAAGPTGATCRRPKAGAS